MNRASQWVGCIVTTWFTWLVYTAHTYYGTDGQADLVASIIFLLSAIALMSCLIDSKLLIKLKPETFAIKMWTDVNIIAQAGLLLATGHWVLAALRAGSEIVVRANVWYADKTEFGRFF